MLSLSFLTLELITNNGDTLHWGNMLFECFSGICLFLFASALFFYYSMICTLPIQNKKLHTNYNFIWPHYFIVFNYYLIMVCKSGGQVTSFIMLPQPLYDKVLEYAVPSEENKFIGSWVNLIIWYFFLMSGTCWTRIITDCF